MTLSLGKPLSQHDLIVTPHGQYGARRPTDLRLAQTHAHQGVDIAAGYAGQPVYPMLEGDVCANDPGIGGHVVTISCEQNGQRYTQVYCDLGAVLVAPGMHVTHGDAIGYVGDHCFVHVAMRKERYGEHFDITDSLRLSFTHNQTC